MRTPNRMKVIGLMGAWYSSRGTGAQTVEAAQFYAVARLLGRRPPLTAEQLEREKRKAEMGGSAWPVHVRRVFPQFYCGGEGV